MVYIIKLLGFEGSKGFSFWLLKCFRSCGDWRLRGNCNPVCLAMLWFPHQKVQLIRKQLFFLFSFFLNGRYTRESKSIPPSTETPAGLGRVLIRMRHKVIYGSLGSTCKYRYLRFKSQIMRWCNLVTMLMYVSTLWNYSVGVRSFQEFEL